MAKLIFRLHNVPDDEAEDVRQLLDEHGFETYETSAGRWRISMPGIWLIDDSRKADARKVIEAYQLERQARLRAEYENARKAGEMPTLATRFKANPLGFAVVLAGLIVVALVSTLPFFSLLPN